MAIKLESTFKEYISKYLTNGLLLLIPVILWNILFAGVLPKAFLPDIFWKDIPTIIATGENVMRIIVFTLPIILQLGLKDKLQWRGMYIYIAGVSIYFLSWIMQMYFPETAWSRSAIGFMAPAYTTIIWFMGIALWGKPYWDKIRYHQIIYITLAVIFVIFHSLHTYVVFSRL